MKSPPFLSVAVILVLALHAPLPARAEPQPGDVFREYVWKPGGKYHVLNAKQSPLALADEFDLVAATKAEAVLEIGNAHLGFEDLALQVNGGEWRPIPFPALGSKEPSPSVYFHQWQPTISLPLAELRDGTNNQFQLRIGPLILITKGTHPAYTCVYSITFRIYYDPAKKPHPSGKITAPQAGSALGEKVELAAEATSPNGPVTRLDFLGHYEDVNYEGDGVFTQWHGARQRGELVNHLGSSGGPAQKAVWDASWVPDQRTPMQIAARVTDSTGLIYFTEPVGGLKLERPGFSVELCQPYDVPPGFTACQYGVWVYQGPRAEKFTLAGDPARVIDARLAMSCWNAPAFDGFTFNGTLLDEVRFTEGDGAHHFFTFPLRPLTALQSGANVLATVPGPARQTDIHWPGVMALVKYTTEQIPGGSLPGATSLRETVTNSIGIKLVRIPAGEIVPGTPEKAPGRVWEERQFVAKISRNFLMGATEVTQEQFREIMGATPGPVRGGPWPAVNVSWFDAVEFCKKLGEREGKIYRLPTEVEWEHACRAGLTNAFTASDTLAPWQANYDGRQSWNGTPKGVYRGGPMRVASFPPNAWGLHDLHGNVWEWCADWYGEYPKGNVTDPRGPGETSRLEATRILRGGAWNSSPNFCRAAFRFRLPPESRYPFTGFRIVRELP